ncbi:hypothetical protein P5673_021024 [Acropora cervicornis]|uniref:Uncharacterized protein n=1 Tax=Acropora cervicornis TaxID=6130 RepID=A0AAD9Q8T4_ACRCE|nr:hypothetical protein P5673_021024 [Acropora cervicornis]
MRRCPSCIKSKSTYPKHGPIQIRIFDGPFDTDGQLPTSSSVVVEDERVGKLVSHKFAKAVSRRRAGESPIASNSIRASSPLLRRIQTRNDPLWRAGGTTLQGHSYQLFQPTTDPITADPCKKVELVLRLVAREDEPEVKFPTGLCTPLSTLRPPPVPE